MTIRKKILLFSAVALGGFLAAVYLVSRFSLVNSFARLESESGQEHVRHLQNALTDEESNLQIMARDYAQWDETYMFMDTHAPDYVRTQLTDATFKLIRINFFALIDQDGHVVFHKSAGSWSPDDADLHTIAEVPAVSRKLTQTQTPFHGVLDLRGRLLLFASEPVLTSRGVGKPKGTLVMAREFDQSIVKSIGQSLGFPVWLEPAEGIEPQNLQGLVWSDGLNAARFESGSTMLNYAAIQDFYGNTVRRLVGRTRRSLFLERKTETRYLWGLLMLAGAIYCATLFFFVDRVLMGRVAGLISEVSKVTVSGDLSLRLDSGGNDELSTLARTVNIMLAAIQKAKAELLQAQESLRFQAEHDALTGVLNRRAIRDVLRKELARCRREKNTLGIILADVDHFKKVNDRSGHAAGDAVLVTVVQRISAILRSYDAVGRYGGEEFLIIAPGCDLALTQKLSERIRAAISDEPIDLGHDTVTISVSLGMTLGTVDSDPEFLVAQADTAMYEAKRKGRNRVEIGLAMTHDHSIELSSR